MHFPTLHPKYQKIKCAEKSKDNFVKKLNKKTNRQQNDNEFARFYY